MLNQPTEFDCIDCGCAVFSFIAEPPDPALCLTCQLLRNTIQDPDEREKIRKRIP